MNYLGPYSEMMLSIGTRAFSRKIAFGNNSIQEFGIWFESYYNAWKIVMSRETFSTLESAKETLDKILVELGWILLTEEQVEKLKVLA
jgi:hypothetical protein